MTVIAIDGPAGAGKSSVAREVARALEVLYVDTGAMYRAIGLAALDAGVDPADEASLREALKGLRLEQGDGTIALNGIDVGDRIRSAEVTRAAAAVAQHAFVRDVLVGMQRSLASHRDVVMEGRDIGTQVFPEAEVKIFLTASLEERTRRRVTQLGLADDAATTREVARDIQKRDESDRTRAVSPLEQAPDAIVVDTTDMTPEEVVEHIRAIAQPVLAGEGSS